MQSVTITNPEEVYDRVEDLVFQKIFRTLDYIDCYPEENLIGVAKNLRRLIRKSLLDGGNEILTLLKEEFNLI